MPPGLRRRRLVTHPRKERIVMKRWSHMLRGWFVVAFALLALALPAAAAAFVPTNPAVPKGDPTAAVQPSGFSRADAWIVLGVAAGVTLTGLALGEFVRPHDRGRHHRLGPVAG
jgi:hypothetical protein